MRMAGRVYIIMLPWLLSLSNIHALLFCVNLNMFLTLSRRRLLSCRNQSIDLPCKSMDWFLYDNGLRHERVNLRIVSSFSIFCQLYRWIELMMNCFCGMVDRRKVFSFIFSRDHCQRSSQLWISDAPRAGFEPAQNLNSGLVEWSYAVVKTTTPLRREIGLFDLLEDLIYNWGFGWIFHMIYSYSEPT